MTPEKATQHTTHRRHVLALLVLVVLVVVANGAQVNHEFTNWDDNWLVTDNPWIRGLSAEHVATVFNPFVDSEIRQQLGNEYLPLRDLSYMLDYSLGKYDASVFLTTNLLIHIFNVLLFYALAFTLFTSMRGAFVAACLFALMPIHVEAVAWVSSRKDLLALFFSLLSTLSYLHFRQQLSKRWLVVAALLFLCALLSKLPVIFLPGIFLLLEWFVRGDKRYQRLSIKQMAVFLAPFAALALVIFALGYSFASQGLIREPFGAGRIDSTVTSLATFGHYLELFVLGASPQAAVDYPVQSIGSPAFLFGGLSLLALLGYAVWTICGKNPKNSPATRQVALGIAWMLIAFIPVSNLIFITGTAYADRYAYLPSVGWCLAIAAAGQAIYLGLKAKKAVYAPILLAACIGIGLWYAYQSHLATDNWRNSKSLWSSVLEQDPENHLASFNLGRDYQERALRTADASSSYMLERASEQYKAALQHRTRTYRYSAARTQLAIALVDVQLKKADEALARLDEDAFKETVAREELSENDQDVVWASFHSVRGQAYEALGEKEQAERAFRRAIDVSPRASAAYLYLAALLVDSAQGRTQALTEALELIERYQKNTYGTNAAALEMQADVMMKQAEFEEGDAALPPPAAVDYYNKAADLYDRATQALLATAPVSNPHRFNVMVKLAEAHQRVPGQEDKAIAILERARSIPSRDRGAGIRTIQAKLFLRTGDIAKAESELKAELVSNPGYEPARAELAALYIGIAVAEWKRIKNTWHEHFLNAYRERSGRDFSGTPDDTALLFELAGDKEFAQALAPVRAYVDDALTYAERGSPSASIGAKFLTSLGHAVYMRGDRHGAEELLRQSYNSDDSLELTSTLLGTIYFVWLEDIGRRLDAALRDGHSQLAEQLYSDMWELIGSVVILSENAAHMLAKSIVRKANRSKVELDEAIEDKDSPAYQRHIKTIVEYYKMALLLDDNQVEALSQLKDYYSESGKYAEAAEAYEKLAAAVETQPLFQREVLRSLGELYFIWANRVTKDYRNALTLGRDEEAKHYREEALSILYDAIPVYERALKLFSATPSREVLEGFGGVYQNLATLDLQEAASYLEKARDLYNLKRESFQVELAFVHRKLSFFLKDPNEQLQELEAAQAYETDADTMQSILTRMERIERRKLMQEVETLLEAGEGEEAYRLMLTQPDSDDHDWRMLYARVLEAKGKTLEAARRYSQLSSDVTAQFRAATLYDQEKDDTTKGEAYVAYRRAIEMFEDAIAQVRAQGGEAEEYEAQLTKAQQRASEIEGLAVELTSSAQGLYESHHLLEAEEQVRRSLEIAPQNPHAHNLMAHIHREWGAANCFAAEENQARRTSLLESAREHYSAAASHYRSAIERTPMEALKIGYALNEAATLIEELLPLVEDSAQRKWLLGNAAIALEQCERWLHATGKYDAYASRLADLEKKLSHLEQNS